MNKAENFYNYWHDKGGEKSDTQAFWLGLLREILDIDPPEKFIQFEKRVDIKHISFIDAYIPSTKIVIEQKSCDVNLDSPAKQSDGNFLTPYEQAVRYYYFLPYSQRGRYIITCNFREIRIYDMETPKAQPRIILLENIAQEKNNLAFIVKPEQNFSHEVEISIRAGELVGKLYDSLIKRYINPSDKESQKSLNIFCVRLVFLLYAEDSGLFAKSQFHDYLKARQNVARLAIKNLFEVLNQRENERDPYIESDLQKFPYVNGGLFEANNIEIPKLDGEPLKIILEDMSEGFESTLNPETRHSGGMHYTSLENIHKVIDPLFLDDLQMEAENLINQPSNTTKVKQLRKFQEKISKITFFDPACGSGNFLTETYLSLRRLENKILTELSKQISFTESESESAIKVSISQFYGIEINDFAVSVARTALLIAESQMWNDTKNIIHFYGDLLPLKIYSHIIEDNALIVNWAKFLPSEGKIYIISNPPFLGYSIQSKAQKQEILSLFTDENGKPYKSAGKIDYVAGWYFKAAEILQDKRIKAAFVSTNSITQGEQVSAIFRPLHERFGINIDFAYQSFIWDSESSDMAHVHVVVIGFDTIDEPGRIRRLFTPEGVKFVNNINFHLMSAPNIFIDARKTAICEDAKFMKAGGKPTEGGNLILTHEEMSELVKANPTAKKFIRPFMMGADFIQRKPRYCLWLVNANPDEIMRCPQVFKRVKRVWEFRLASKKEATQRKAETPALFDEIIECKTNYIAIPKTSSGNRQYIPIGWLDNSVIPGDELRIIPDAALYDFGILTSRIHMAWMRRVAGRLGMGYRYTNTIVYNNFVWPSPNDKQRAKIESTAQKILDARNLYPDSSFASLYNDMLMPAELRKAHRENDSAVCEAYGWDKDISEGEIAANLFELYQKLTRIKIS